MCLCITSLWYFVPLSKLHLQDFWEAALHVEVGNYTRAPVKTEWGYHIIMVQARK